VASRWVISPSGAEVDNGSMSLSITPPSSAEGGSRSKPLKNTTPR
jgi:hypothetical protein